MKFHHLSQAKKTVLCTIHTIWSVKCVKTPFPAQSGTLVGFVDVERSGGGYDMDPIQVNIDEMKLMMFT